MIHAKTCSDGRSRREALIFTPHESRHKEILSARSVQQAKHYILCLADIWKKLLDIADLNLLILI